MRGRAGQEWSRQACEVGPGISGRTGHERWDRTSRPVGGGRGRWPARSSPPLVRAPGASRERVLKARARVAPWSAAPAEPSGTLLEKAPNSPASHALTASAPGGHAPPPMPGESSPRLTTGERHNPASQAWAAPRRPARCRSVTNPASASASPASVVPVSGTAEPPPPFPAPPIFTSMMSLPITQL